jgi:hypothetical protein
MGTANNKYSQQLQLQLAASLLRCYAVVQMLVPCPKIGERYAVKLDG